jgi:hypothetical protein
MYVNLKYLVYGELIFDLLYFDLITVAAWSKA